MLAGLARTWHKTKSTRLFIRFNLLLFTVVVPLFGAASVTANVAGFQLCGLLGVALAYHIFGYVLNDVIDLPVDRTEPQRAAYPLVRGTIQPGQALAIALMQVPLALALTALLGGTGAAYVALGLSFALAAAYDLWGKRSPWPPLIDLVQALSWAAWMLYGALIVGGTPTRLTGVLAGFIIVYILMVNGVHASLRDLPNDLRRGMRTTAILLGVRPTEAAGIRLSVRLKLYVLLLQALLTGLILVPLYGNWLNYAPPR